MCACGANTLGKPQKVIFFLVDSPLRGDGGKGLSIKELKKNIFLGFPILSEDFAGSQSENLEFGKAFDYNKTKLLSFQAIYIHFKALYKTISISNNDLFNYLITMSFII